MMGVVKVCETIMDHRPMESGTDVNYKGHTQEGLNGQIGWVKMLKRYYMSVTDYGPPTRLWACICYELWIIIQGCFVHYEKKKHGSSNLKMLHDGLYC